MKFSHTEWRPGYEWVSVYMLVTCSVFVSCLESATVFNFALRCSNRFFLDSVKKCRQNPELVNA